MDTTQTANIRWHANRRVRLRFEPLEDRSVPATAVLAGTALTVTGGPGDDRIRIYSDGTQLHVLEGTVDIGDFALGAVTTITVNTSPGANDTVIIDPNLTQTVVLNGQGQTNKLVAGGGPTTLLGGPGVNQLFGSSTAPNTFNSTFNGAGGTSFLYLVRPTDLVIPDPNAQILPNNPPPSALPPQALSASDVGTLLQRAAAASASTDAIIAVVDRDGQILGVRAESGVSPNITGNTSNLVFAVDGAVAEARTAAMFANNQAPLTSRTIQFISQSTITQREVESNPSITDPNSPLAGPGFVAPVRINGTFPPGILGTSVVDLFNIEYTNRDTSILPNGQIMPDRFNIDPAFVPPGAIITPPNSYGFVSGLEPNAQPRGIGTLPGGVPLYKNGQLVGGIGVFFPGTTGYADAENSSLSNTFNPALPDRSLEAEWMAFAAAGGTVAAIPTGGAPLFPVGALGGVSLPPGFGLPTGRIDLVTIQLPVFGVGGSVQGVLELKNEAAAVGRGDPNNGANLPLTGGATLLAGQPVPAGWLVLPHDGVGITGAQANDIITQGLVQANNTRAQIRLPIGVPAQYVFAVSDKAGNIVALYREPDATTFSIDVAVAKARNVAYYNDPTQLQAADQLPGIPAGVAFTNRTFRYLAEPLVPQGAVTPPGPFSILTSDPGIDPHTGLLTGPPLPAVDYFGSVSGFVAFNPRANFHDPNNLANQNGVVFFPGSSGLYVPGGTTILIGGLGVSGDGVDEDDVTTVSAESGFGAPPPIQVSNFPFQGILLPYQLFNRNPDTQG
jgi:uncharacterized protein GlcG (DUF336 family)